MGRRDMINKTYNVVNPTIHLPFGGVFFKLPFHPWFIIRFFTFADFAVMLSNMLGFLVQSQYQNNCRVKGEHQRVLSIQGMFIRVPEF